MSRLDQRLRQLQLLVLDVDGVLTDGGLGYAPDGQVWRRFDVRDGLGLKLLQQAGLTLAWISGGSSGAIERRAEDLGVPFCFSEVKMCQIVVQREVHTKAQPDKFVLSFRDGSGASTQSRVTDYLRLFSINTASYGFSGVIKCEAYLQDCPVSFVSKVGVRFEVF